MASSFKLRVIKITAYSWGFDSRKTYISLVKNLLDDEQKEQSVQRSGQQQPNCNTHFLQELNFVHIGVHIKMHIKL
jgi:hypothetical protein